MTVVPETSGEALEPRVLRDVFGAFPSGVVAVAGRVGGRLVGLAASSFTSVSIDPPLVSFSVARSSNTWPVLREAGELGVSVLADHHDTLCRQLAGPADRRFDELALRTSPGGAVLLDEAVATLACTLHAEIDAGDHLIVLLRVLAVRAEAGRSPLVFHESGFKRLHRDDLDPAALDGRINGEPVRRADERGTDEEDAA
jgi:flavin reductase (DIM6/NTAB) family NADH-FMN oxidoreductase RutF